MYDNYKNSKKGYCKFIYKVIFTRLLKFCVQKGMIKVDIFQHLHGHWKNVQTMMFFTKLINLNNINGEILK